MVTILADGENSHRLEDADGRHIGSIRDRAIRLHGLASEADAVAAAVAVWQALDVTLARAFPGWPRHEPAVARVRLVHDGAYRWISDGKRPLARLVQLPPDDSAGGSLAIEFVLPSYASEGVMISAAQLMARTLDEYLRPRAETAETVSRDGDGARSATPAPA